MLNEISIMNPRFFDEVFLPGLSWSGIADINCWIISNHQPINTNMFYIINRLRNPVGTV